MVKLSLKNRTIKRLKTINKYIKLRTILNKLKIKFNIRLNRSLIYLFLLWSLMRKVSNNTYKFSCSITGRYRSNYKFFGLSRHIIINLFNNLNLPSIYLYC